MARTRGRGDLGPVPTWMEIQGLSEESLRAAVTGLGVEILGALCARAEPPTVRVRLCSLSARRFTYTMYVELCRYMESCRAGRGSERTVVAGRGKITEGGPGGVVWIKVKEKGSLGSPEGRDPEHAIRDNRIRNFPRSSCSHSFTAEAALTTHTKKHRPDSREKECKCTEYPFCVHNQSHLVRHAEIPTKMSDACTVCGGEEFDHASHCNRRMSIHNEDRPYTCSLCGKAFDQSSPYRIHMRRHTGEQQYSCKVCLTPFSNRSTLIRHLRLHRGEKPYTCNVCGEGFNLLTYRQMHMNLHKGEYPYTCTQCGKAFGHPGNFQKHMKIHSGE